jgi:hypothetical protein
MTRFAGLLQSPLPDSNRRPPPSMPSNRQAVATHGNGFGLFLRFLRRAICDRLRPVATTGLHKGSSLSCLVRLRLADRVCDSLAAGAGGGADDALRSATGRNPRQRFRLVFAASAPIRSATDRHRLQPTGVHKGSIVCCPFWRRKRQCASSAPSPPFATTGLQRLHPLSVLATRPPKTTGL